MTKEDELIYSYEELEDLVIKYQNISNNLQKRIDKAVTRIKTIINIIKEQPTDNIHTDMYIIEALNSLVYILEEVEENE